MRKDISYSILSGHKKSGMGAVISNKGDIMTQSIIRD